jgi:hypothetical protein
MQGGLCMRAIVRLWWLIEVLLFVAIEREVRAMRRRTSQRLMTWPNGAASGQ